MFNRFKKKIKTIVASCQLRVDRFLETRIGDILDAFYSKIKFLILLFRIVWIYSWYTIKYRIMYNLLGKDETERICEAFWEEALEIYMFYRPRTFNQLLYDMSILLLFFSLTNLVSRIFTIVWAKHLGGNYALAKQVVHVANLRITMSIIFVFFVIFLLNVFVRYTNKKKK
jgi:hypothetical protein